MAYLRYTKAIVEFDHIQIFRPATRHLIGFMGRFNRESMYARRVIWDIDLAAQSSSSHLYQWLT
jgi:hypothetical protein